MKIWASDRQDHLGNPSCLRVINPDPRPPSHAQRGHPPPLLNAMAIHTNMSLMALGFSDGSVMLYRGKIFILCNQSHRKNKINSP